MKNNDPVDSTIRLAITQWPDDAPRGSVTAFCTEHNISRKTFYKILNRARTEGQAAALAPRSRRPTHSPNSTNETLKDQAIAVRKALEEAGWDHGPISVHDKMLSLGLNSPSIAALARIFRERGVITPSPRKRPRSSYRSFRYPMPNACWQLDATEYRLEGGRKCVIFQLIDDHSRLALASLVARTENSKAAVEVFRRGVDAHGIPQRLLSDNGEAINPIRRGMVSELVAYANSLGVATITGKPYKPTTQGKNERLHSTLFKWLKKQPYVKDLPALQRQVDAFDHAYNNERGHQSLEERMTPQQAWDATPVADPPTVDYALKYSTKPASTPAREPVTHVAGPVTTESVGTPARLMATLRSDQMGRSGQQMMRANKNRCIRIAGVEIYLGKLLRSTPLKACWDQHELLLMTIQGELIARYDFPFPEGTKYRSLKHATALFENPREDQ